MLKILSMAIILSVWISLTHEQLIQSTLSYSDLVVKTRNGNIRGLAYTSGGKRVMNSWRGVPFAQKPLGSLRFQPPKEALNWTGELNTTSYGPACMQSKGPVDVGSSTSEDCLYLNIFAPHPAPTNVPVMVWIHGGAFVIGSATGFDPSIIVTTQNVLVVTIQYRLNIFGFMYLNASYAPGNVGMLDQVMALRWIRDNIQSFGGDTSRITLFGQSAGGASVSHLLLSPLARDLFNNGIIESGSSLMPDVVANSSAAIDGYKSILTALGCTQTNLQTAIACAQNISATKIQETMTRVNPLFESRPLVDGYFFTEDPTLTLSKGTFKKCPIMIGSTKDEKNFAWRMDGSSISKPSLNKTEFQRALREQIPNYPNYPTPMNEMTFKAVLNQYVDWGNIDNDQANFYNLDYAMSDYTFHCPIADLANSFAHHNNKVYLYSFVHHSSQAPYPAWLGSVHGEEVDFVFGAPLASGSNFTAAEKTLSTRIIKYWTNFARYGDPNDPQPTSTSSTCSSTIPFVCTIMNFVGNIMKSDPLPSWPVYQFVPGLTMNDKQRAYLVFQTGNLGIDYNFRANSCALWNYYLPSLNSLPRTILYPYNI